MGGASETGTGNFGVGILRANEGMALVDKVNMRIRGFRGTWVYRKWKQDKLKLFAISPTFTEGLLSCTSYGAGPQTLGKEVITDASCGWEHGKRAFLGRNMTCVESGGEPG